MIQPVLHIKAPGEADVERSDQVREVLEGRLVYAFPMYLVGTRLFSVRLEYEHFTPGTEANQDFDLYALTWHGPYWGIISVPPRIKEEAEEIIREVGLDYMAGAPVIQEEDQVVDYFPIAVPLMYTLTWPKDRKRTKRPDKIERALSRENIKIDAIIQSHNEKDNGS